MTAKPNISLKEDEETAEIPLGQGSERKFGARQRTRASLIVLAGPVAGTFFTIDEDVVELGRSQDNQLSIDDPGMSRKHGRIRRDGTGYYYEDLGSKNGSYVGGRVITEPHMLLEGERILLGKSTVIRFSLQDDIEHEAAMRIYEAAVRDPLTKLHNRRYLDDIIQSEFAFALRHGSPLTLLMIDIDHFKKINDTYGHLAGDEVLRQIAALLQRAVRAEDLVARFGGEEFVVLAKGTQAQNASVVAERIRRMAQRLVIRWEDQTIQVTVSIGLATRTPEKPYTDVTSLLGAADDALYQAKESGRNAIKGLE